MEQRNRATPVTIMVIVICAFVMVGVWWLEDRFDASTAVMVIGGLAGVACVIIGFVLNMASNRHAFHIAADFYHDLATTDKHRQQAFAQLMRSAGQVQLLEAKSVDQLARQRAGLIVDLERQKHEQAQQQPAGTYLNWDEFANDMNYEEVG